jgi:Bifunctional DNA primase/polymerase, N-terminal
VTPGLAAAAGAYARLGLAVFPCAPRTKTPRTLHGHLDATTDPEIIAGWWGQWPDANLAIACAASRLTVIDLDPRNDRENGIAQFVTEHAAVLSATWAVKTSCGGRHYYFQWPSPVEDAPRFARALLPGVEVKGNGYVLAPPSVHPLGDRYRFVPGQSPRDLESELGRRPAACPLELWRRMTKPVPVVMAIAGGLVTESLLAELCHRRGLVRGLIGGDRLAVSCPWRAKHSMESGTSEAVLFPPLEPRGLGGFHCSHAHCAGRGPRELLGYFTPEEIEAARVVLDARVSRPRPPADLDAWSSQPRTFETGSMEPWG